MTLICHILIGCPSSGKSTVADKIKQNNPNYRIVSSDQIREQLYGDATIQGNWPEIETEIFKQINQHLNDGYPIIYDATNAKQVWRVELLQKLSQFNSIDWVGWYLKTPLAICLNWNDKRIRKVPPEIIQQMYEELQAFPPTISEGFTVVYEIPYQKNNLNLEIIDIKLKNLDRN